MATRKALPRHLGEFWQVGGSGIYEYLGRAPTLFPKDPSKPSVHRAWFRHLGSPGPKVMVPLREVGAFLGTSIQEAMDEERRLRE
jgi:hypothetical protein